MEKEAMNGVSTSQARNQFSTIINRAAFGQERIVLTRRGKEIAAVVPVEDLRLLEEIEDRMDIEAAQKALKEPGEIPYEEIRRELGLPPVGRRSRAPSGARKARTGTRG